MFKLAQIALVSATLTLAAPAFATDQADYQYYQANKSQFLSFDAAKKRAMALVPNARSVKEIEFDRGFMRSYFDVEVIDENGMDVDVKIDAKTGEALN